MYCPNCGVKCDDNFKFCIKCGTDLNIKNHINVIQIMEEGRRFFISENFYEAIKCFNKVLEEHPSNIGVLLYKADCLLRLGHMEDAVECYEKILKFEPTHFLSWIQKVLHYII